MKAKDKYHYRGILLLLIITHLQGREETTSPYFDNITIESKSREIDNWITQNIKSEPKPLTLIVYIAADNDLERFAGKNIKQMASVGSNEFINIVVILHIKEMKENQNKKTTNKYIIMKDKIINADSSNKSEHLDSGDPKTLISCFEWAMKTCPAQEYALILWDHGTGIIDPRNGRLINSPELFTYNMLTNKFEVDRSLTYLDRIKEESEDRGICWDDTTGNYLTNQDLQYALKTISQDLLKGKKLAILGFDACLMSMIEIANLAKDYVKIMVGSQEIVLGPGWNYKYMLEPFKNESLNYCEFAEHMVTAYKNAYYKMTDDYTLAAVDLQHITALEDNVMTIADLLEQSIILQRNNSVKKAIYVSKHKKECTHFDDPNYIDLDHFLHNLSLNLKLFNLCDSKEEKSIKYQLTSLIRKGRELINSIVFANTTGPNFKYASGLSIYFPERKIHNSYPKTPFAQTSSWLSFLTAYHKP